MYVDATNIFGKNKKDLERIIPTVRNFSQDIGIKFWTEKYTMLIRNKENRETTEGIELLNQESIGTIGEKDCNKYLIILDRRKNRSRGWPEGSLFDSYNTNV